MGLGLRKNHVSLWDPENRMEIKDDNDYYRLYKKGPTTRLECLQTIQGTYILNSIHFHLARLHIHILQNVRCPFSWEAIGRLKAKFRASRAYALKQPWKNLRPFD